MGTCRPLTTTAIAAGIGIAAALTLGPMATAATSAAARHDLQPASATHDRSAKSAAQTAVTSGDANSSDSGSSDAGSGQGSDILAGTGLGTTPLTAGGVGTLVAGIGLVYAARRLAT